MLDTDTAIAEKIAEVIKMANTERNTTEMTPNKSRYYAVTITELEKAYSYFLTFVLNSIQVSTE